MRPPEGNDPGRIGLGPRSMEGKIAARGCFRSSWKKLGWARIIFLIGMAFGRGGESLPLVVDGPGVNARHLPAFWNNEIYEGPLRQHLHTNLTGFIVDLR